MSYGLQRGFLVALNATLTNPLPVSSGGTGASTLTGVLTGNGTSPFTASLVTQHDVLVGGASNAITSITPSASSGIALISQGVGADPIFGTVTVPGGGTGAISLTGLVIGNGTSAFTTTTITQHDVLVGGTSNAITSVAPSATSGVALVSQGAAVDPAFGTVVVAGGGTGAVSLTGVLTGNGTSPFTASAITQHDVLVGGASNAIISVAPSATSGIPLVSTGAASNPAFGTAVVAGGGTGAVTLTGILTGNGTSAVTANAVTQHGVLIGGASNAASSLGVAATGTVLIGNTGADPSFSANPTVTTIVVGNNNFSSATVTTVDATQTTIFTLTLSANTTVQIFATVHGTRSDWTQGIFGNINAGARKVGAGAAVMIGTPMTNIQRDVGSTLFTAVVSGNTLLIQVKGVAAQTWDWLTNVQWSVVS